MAAYFVTAPVLYTLGEIPGSEYLRDSLDYDVSSIFVARSHYVNRPAKARLNSISTAGTFRLGGKHQTPNPAADFG